MTETPEQERPIQDDLRWWADRIDDAKPMMTPWEIGLVKLLRSGADHLTAAEARCRQLEDWKESALKSLEKWHKVGDALQPVYPLQIGDDIPGMLLAFIENDSPLNSAIDSLRQAEAESAALRLTLRTYGDHDSDCLAKISMIDSDCGCGFSAALLEKR